MAAKDNSKIKSKSKEQEQEGIEEIEEDVLDHSIKIIKGFGHLDVVVYPDTKIISILLKLLSK